ncbi:MAG: phosphoadenylyl-sulfate reductase [Planctomycetota bacterium]|jgi:phosphoadenosine phosphosulfate reductase
MTQRTGDVHSKQRLPSGLAWQWMAESQGDKPATATGPHIASDEELASLHRQSLAMENATPEEIISWAVKTYFPKLAMATAFGPEGCLILAMLAKIEPRVYVFNLDTGYQFKETLQTRDRIAERYGIVVDLQGPELTAEQFEAVHGGPLYRTDSNRCCRERKAKVLQQVIKGYDAWMSGIRRDQSPHRAKAPIVGWDAKFGLVKINPLANWSSDKVWDRVIRDQVPYNPLHDQGYPSVGCWPCTVAIGRGEDERAGRWSGCAKTECGLHVAD